VRPPDLRALRSGDASAWDEAFRWLWPTAFAVAKIKLKETLPGDIEDVAIEAIEELVPSVDRIGSSDDLKPLVASIAHNVAVSRLRQRFARKRGGGQIDSLESVRESTGDPLDPPDSSDPPSEGMGQRELAGLLRELLVELKPQQRAILSDFFLDGLAYEKIASKHSVAIGTVGVYLKRGLEAVARCAQKRPKLLKELTAFLRCIL
jgi:RNA polymerase sigma factor (sigma-70 family)